jgi:acetyltransferase
LEDVTKDAENDGVMVILTPQAMTDPTETARRVAPFAKLKDRPILASWMGGAAMEEGRSILNQAGLPCFPFPDTAARLFNYMWRYSSNLKSLYETPSLPEGAAPPDRPKAEVLLAQARQAGRDLLSEYESKSLLWAYGIPTVDTRLAQSAEEAAQMAEALGYPVVLKLHSFTVTHKTDVGGVKLNLTQAKDVRQAFSDIQESVTRLKGEGHFQGVTVQKQVKWEGYELILGSSLDPQVGPVLLFGSGGQLVEIYKDHALGLPPLNTTLARRLMERTRIYEALKGIRGRAPVDLSALEQLLVRFSWLIAEQPFIKEMDINPLLASPEGLVALDARVLLHPKDTPDSELSHTAIRPYPAQYTASLTLKDGTTAALRPIRPEDEPAMVRFHETLSAQSVYLRYFQEMKLDTRTTHERLTRTCFVDYDREMVLVALREDKILGVVRFSRTRKRDEAEFSMILSDAFQNQGLGSQMLKGLLTVARSEKLKRVTGTVLPENVRMQALCTKLGFSLDRRESEGLVVVTANL